MATSDWVQMKHPNIPDAQPAVATREAFDEVWKDKGWNVIAEAEAPGDATPIFVPVDSPKAANAGRSVTPAVSTPAQKES